VPDVRYLSTLDVIALRATYLEQLGFQVPPLRDIGLLESAVYRPQMAAHYEGADLIRQAALLGAGIIQNHPFGSSDEAPSQQWHAPSNPITLPSRSRHDGNKRGAYVAMTNFLRLNGIRVRFPAGNPLALAEELEAVATRRSHGADLDEATDALEGWLRAHTEPVAGAP
jgi:prophage maintenance system killer protein